MTQEGDQSLRHLGWSTVPHMNVLIVGGSGFLGAELIRQVRAAGHTTAATYATKPGDTSQAVWHNLDLRDGERLDAVMAEVRPHLVINASSGKADWAVTAQGPVRIAKAAAETRVLGVHPGAVVARTSLIIGDGRSAHEIAVHELSAGTRDGVLFTDDIRCPVHVADLAAALVELALSEASGIHHLAGPDALSRHELGTLIARRDGIDASRLPAGLRAHSTLPGALDVRLDSRATQRKLSTTLRGARQFCTASA